MCCLIPNSNTVGFLSLGLALVQHFAVAKIRNTLTVPQVPVEAVEPLEPVICARQTCKTVKTMGTRRGRATLGTYGTCGNLGRLELSNRWSPWSQRTLYGNTQHTGNGMHTCILAHQQTVVLLNVPLRTNQQSELWSFGNLVSHPSCLPIILEPSFCFQFLPLILSLFIFLSSIIRSSLHIVSHYPFIWLSSGILSPCILSPIIPSSCLRSSLRLASHDFILHHFVSRHTLSHRPCIPNSQKLLGSISGSRAAGTTA